MAFLAALLSPSAHAQLIPGMKEWADQAALESQPKWIGPRVAFPNPRKRPAPPSRLRSALRPVAVHFGDELSYARARQWLAAFEEAYDLLAVTGFTSGYGDSGQGGTFEHDVYAVSGLGHGNEVGVDATESLRSLDGTRAFALLDPLISGANLAACATEALAAVYLMELDPAEAETVRRSSAAYLAWLATGQMGCSDQPERADELLSYVPFAPGSGAAGALWLAALERRETRHSGTFLREMWHFARQRTWEGAGLRASPDLIEAIDTAISLKHEKLEDVAGELAIERLLEHPSWALAQAGKLDKRSTTLPTFSFAELPEHLKPADPPLGSFAASYALVRVDAEDQAQRIRVWSRGELGVRWSLQAAKIAQDGSLLSRVRAPTRDDPSSFLIVDLDARTRWVAIAVTHLSDGTPDPDSERAEDVRTARLMVDR
jgi:hypothetical protein